MSLILTVNSGSVPDGIYSAILKSICPTSNEYGQGVRWEFEVIGGAHSGSKVSRTTGDKPTPKNAAGRFLAGFVGGALTPGATISTNDFIGGNFMIVVATTESGASRVESVSPAPVNGTDVSFGGERGKAGNETA